MKNWKNTACVPQVKAQGGEGSLLEGLAACGRGLKPVGGANFELL